MLHLPEDTYDLNVWSSQKLILFLPSVKVALRYSAQSSEFSCSKLTTDVFQ